MLVDALKEELRLCSLVQVIVTYGVKFYTILHEMTSKWLHERFEFYDSRCCKIIFPYVLIFAQSRINTLVWRYAQRFRHAMIMARYYR